MRSIDYFGQLRENARALPDHPVFQILGEDRKETFTNRQVVDEIRKVSRFLADQGVEKGQAVGIIMENHPRWGIAYLAAQSAGAIVVPLDILHSAETLAWLLEHAECRFLIVSRGLSEKLDEIEAHLQEKLPVLLVGGDGCGGRLCWRQAVDGEADGEIPMPLVERDPRDPLSIMYTSGTTGDPKGVVLSAEAIYLNVEAVFERIKVRPEDHILSVLPLYHALALMANFLMPLYINARTTYLPSIEAQRILKAFHDEGITIFVAVPQFFYLVHKRIEKRVQEQSFLKRRLFNLLLGISRRSNEWLGYNPGRAFFGAIHDIFGKDFNFFAVGGARFEPQIARSFRDLGFKILQAYGLTETAAVATVTPLDSKSVGSVGEALPHTEVEVEDPDERGIGEVAIRSPSLMEGYWKNPEATNEAIRDGWLHTGDLGYLDERGRLFITGRKKDVIVLSSGKNIFPEEIESFYEKRIDLIKEMCVIGVPDETSGEGQEKLHAVVVPDFEESSRQQIVNVGDMVRYLIENTSQKLPPHKRVRSFSIRREPLPRTTTRKIKRFEVQQEWEEEERRERSRGEALAPEPEQEPSSPVEAKVYRLIRQVKKAPRLSKSMNLELDVGFDSLQRVEFLSNVQDAFGVHISDDAAAEIFTVGELVRAVEKRLAGEVEDEEKESRSWREILEAPLEKEETERKAEVMDPRPVYEFLVYLTTLLTKLLAKILFRYKAVGQEHLPEDYPFLICPNHQSYLDAPLVAAAMPYRVVKRSFYLGYSDYFENAFMRWVARACKVVPVDPDRNLRQALRLGAEGLRRGQILVVFPEGERTIDGDLKPFRGGPAILSEVMRVPVVPVAITGAYQAWPRGSNKIRLHPIRIRIGKPLDPPSSPEDRDDFTARLKQAVRELAEGEPLTPDV